MMNGTNLSYFRESQSDSLAMHRQTVDGCKDRFDPICLHFSDVPRIADGELIRKRSDLGPKGRSAISRRRWQRMRN